MHKTGFIFLLLSIAIHATSHAQDNKREKFKAEML